MRKGGEFVLNRQHLLILKAMARHADRMPGQWLTSWGVNRELGHTTPDFLDSLRCYLTSLRREGYVISKRFGASTLVYWKLGPLSDRLKEEGVLEM